MSRTKRMLTAAGLLGVCLSYIYTVRTLGDSRIHRSSSHLPTRALEETRDTSINILSILSPRSSVVVLLSMAFGVFAMLEYLNAKFGGSKEEEQHHKHANQKGDLEADLKKSETILERAEQEKRETVEETVFLNKGIEALQQEKNTLTEDFRATLRDAKKLNQTTGKENQGPRMNIHASLANCDQTLAASVETPETIKSIQLERDEARAALAKANQIIHFLRQRETFLEDTQKTREKREQCLHDELQHLKSIGYVLSLKMTGACEYIESTVFSPLNQEAEQSLARIKYMNGYSSSITLKALGGRTFSPEERVEYHATELQRLYDEARSVLRSRQPLAKSINEKLDETLETAQKARAIIAELDNSSG